MKTEKPGLEKLAQYLKERRVVLLSRLRVKGKAYIVAANPDCADLAQDYYLQDRSQALRDLMEGTLEQVDGALERIEEGAYGNCHDCGKDISPARLQALPYAKLCVVCQAELEKKESNHA
jgi:RNA polymerase-binding transcription factor DksA